MVGESYKLRARDTTDITSPQRVGVGLIDEAGQHRGWVKEESRARAEGLFDAEKSVFVRVTKLGRRWEQCDTHLGQTRRYRLGEGVVEVD